MNVRQYLSDYIEKQAYRKIVLELKNLPDGIDIMAGDAWVQVIDLPQRKSDKKCWYDCSNIYCSKNVCIPQGTHHKRNYDHGSVKTYLDCGKSPSANDCHRLDTALAGKWSDVCRHIDEYAECNQEYTYNQKQTHHNRWAIEWYEWNIIQRQICEIWKEHTVDELQKPFFCESLFAKQETESQSRPHWKQMW